MIEFLTNLTIGIVNLFNDVNSGNPACIGIGYSLGVIFSLLLIYIIKIRTTLTMDKHHIFALVGSALLAIRFFVLLIFYWGYQINLYSDKNIFMFMNPIEHFFYALALICFGYYSLIYYRYFPGLLKKIIWSIPVSITTFFIVDSIKYKDILATYKNIPDTISCSIDWQLHFVLLISSLYILIVSFFKIDKSNILLNIFWIMVFISQYLKTIFGFYNIEPSFMITIFNSIQIWSIMILILHFIKNLYHLCKNSYFIHTYPKLKEITNVSN